MAKKKKGFANPSQLSAIDDDGQIQVIIETPKGSRNKFAFDPDQRAFKLKKVLPEGMVFPHDFGFIPSTEAEDSDPLDVLLLMDQPAFPGCLVEARLIGVIEGEQSEDGKKERNDRLLAVASTSHTHLDINSVHDLSDSLVDEIQKFFVNYHANDGKQLRALGCKGPEIAAKCLKRSQK